MDVAYVATHSNDLKHLPISVKDVLAAYGDEDTGYLVSGARNVIWSVWPV